MTNVGSIYQSLETAFSACDAVDITSDMCSNISWPHTCKTNIQQLYRHHFYSVYLSLCSEVPSVLFASAKDSIFFLLVLIQVV